MTVYSRSALGTLHSWHGSKSNDGWRDKPHNPDTLSRNLYEKNCTSRLAEETCTSGVLSWQFLRKFFFSYKFLLYYVQVCTRSCINFNASKSDARNLRKFRINVSRTGLLSACQRY